MNSQTALADKVIEFHECLCNDWEHAGYGLVEPSMVLYVPDSFPWQPINYHGVDALRHFRDALDVISDRTFKVSPLGHTADERLVAIRCHETATRNSRFLEWTSLWTYIVADGQISETRVVHSVAGDDLADFWCT
jgi:ketosteroid isomerase-like protein